MLSGGNERRALKREKHLTKLAKRAEAGKAPEAYRCKTLQLDIDCEGPRTEKGFDIKKKGRTAKSYGGT